MAPKTQTDADVEAQANDYCADCIEAFPCFNCFEEDPEPLQEPQGATDAEVARVVPEL